MARDDIRSKQTYSVGADGRAAHADRVFIQNASDLARQSAFGDTMVVETRPEVYTTFPYHISSGLVKSSGTGDHALGHGSGMVYLQTGTGINSKAVLETRRSLVYVPGFGGNIKVTPLFTSGVGSQLQLAGYGNDEHGFFVGMSGATFGIFHRKTHVGPTDFIPQSDFNGTKFDGTNGQPALDVTKGNVFEIQFQWLGYGQISFNMENPNTGRLQLMHSIKYANRNVQPSIQQASAPVRIEIDNNGDGGQLQMQASCLAGFVEGPAGLTNTFGASGSALTSSAQVNLMTIRNRETFHSVNNNRPIRLTAISIGNVGNRDIVVEGVKNYALSGSPSYVDVDTDESVAEIDADGTIIAGVSGVFGGALIGNATTTTVDLEPYDIELTPGESATLIVRRTATQTTEVIGFLTWKELY